MMEFWIICVLMLIFLYIGEVLIKKPYKKLFPVASILFLWFIYSFRYQIGIDYDTYINLFYFVTSDNLFYEPSFRYIVEILRENDFSFQMLFVVYATLMFYFIWQGLKDYNVRYYPVTLSLLLFFTNPWLWSYSLSALRQFVAVAIIFWGYKFLINRSFYKYVSTVALATMFHKSAIIMLIFYWILNKKIGIKYNIIILCISLLLGYFHVVKTFGEYIFPYMGGYGKYIDASANSVSSGFALMFYFGVYILYLIIRAKREENDIKGNAMLITLVITFVAIDFPPLMRSRLYFWMFYIFVLQDIFFYIKNNINRYIAYGMIIPIMVLFFHEIYVSDEFNNIDKWTYGSRSAGNVNYEFNFRLEE